jgi:hypothetical protein
MNHLAAWHVLSSQVVNGNWNYTNSVIVAANQEAGWNVGEVFNQPYT